MGSDNERIFTNCDAAAVFNKVSELVTSSELRPLWASLLEEINNGDVTAALSYLGAQYDELSIQLRRELDRFPENGKS